MVLSCSTPRKPVSSAKVSPYKKDVNTIHPEFEIFHLSDIISELHFKINSKELLYSRTDGINFSCNVLISYQLLDDESKSVSDTSSFRLVDINNDNADKFLVGKINFFARKTNNYYLHVTVNDLNRNNSIIKIIFIQKDNEINRQNFLVKSAETDLPLFHNYTKLGEKLRIIYKVRAPSKIYVRYYNRDFPIAAPPFSEFTLKPFQYREDSLFILELSSDGVIDFAATKKGFYHFQYDSTSHDGFTLYNFSGNFPDIKKAEDMIPPLRYITSRAEYNELIANPNKKAALDKFWLNNTGNHDRARGLIKKYYGRVQEANNYFSSYIEGWKTDRGMIFLIYGSPNLIYHTDHTETWTYGEENNVNSTTYTFVKVNNPFTDNDYILERSAFYKQSWFMSVDAWRQGRAFTQD